jgi:hypothetical protein
MMTLQQFSGLHLALNIQPKALALVTQYVDDVAEHEVEGSRVLEFPGGIEVEAQRQLERVQAYMRFAAAAVAPLLAPECAWPEPGSLERPADPRESAVWISLEQLAVVALSERDTRPIHIDTDPQTTVLDDLLEACVPDDVVLPLRSPTTLAPELGNDEDASWQISHAAQIQAFETLQDQFSDPDTTAPVSTAVATVAPRCPWGDKTRYGLAMTALWYDVRRLARIADRQEAA